MGCNGFQVFFRCVFQVFHKHVSSVSTVFRHMLQRLYLDVSKVDLALYLSYSHILLHRLSRSRQGIHTNEGGRGHGTRELRASSARYGRTLPTERDGGCVLRGLGARARARGDVGATGGCAGVAYEGARRLRRTGAAFGRRSRARHQGSRLAEIGNVSTFQ